MTQIKRIKTDFFTFKSVLLLSSLLLFLYMDSNIVFYIIIITDCWSKLDDKKFLISYTDEWEY